MSEPFLGMICIFGFDYVPFRWAPCQGQSIALQQNAALYALLGTQFGGNGQTTFNLPDLRGKAPVGMQAAGYGNAGIQTGTPTTSLTSANLPAHNHLINASSAPGDAVNPAGAYRANTGVFDKEYKASSTATVPMNVQMVGNTGQGTAFSIMQPSLALNYCIALQGDFPQFS